MPINSFLYPGAKFVPPYQVANSLRFEDGDSAYLERNFSTTQDSRRKFTFSACIALSFYVSKYIKSDCFVKQIRRLILFTVKAFPLNLV